MFEYRPVPKKPFKGKKKQEVFKGRTIPTKKQRGSVSKTTAKRVFEIHDEYCVVCGSNQIELHHVKPKGFSNGGRGTVRNLIPLCPEHHRGKEGVHNDKRLMQKLQYEQEKRFGKYYYMDKFDLFKLGLIPNTEDEEFEKFMKRMEKTDG
jgi:hypothetical protein